MITGAVYVDRQLLASGATNPISKRFERVGAKVVDAVSRAVERNAIEVTATVKRKLSGEVLKNRTGTLRRSIHYIVEAQPGMVTATVGANMDEAKYARIHEYGGTINHPAREHTLYFHMSKSGDVGNKFVKKGKSNFAQKSHVGAWTQVVKERSYLRSSLLDHRDQIIKSIQKAGVTAVIEAMKS